VQQRCAINDDIKYESFQYQYHSIRLVKYWILFFMNDKSRIEISKIICDVTFFFVRIRVQSAPNLILIDSYHILLLDKTFNRYFQASISILSIDFNWETIQLECLLKICLICFKLSSDQSTLIYLCGKFQTLSLIEFVKLLVNRPNGTG